MDLRSSPVSSRPAVKRAPAAAASCARSVASTKASAATTTRPSGVENDADTMRFRPTSTSCSRQWSLGLTPAACSRSRSTRSALRTSTPSVDPILRTNSRVSPPYSSSPAESQLRSKVLSQLCEKLPPTHGVGSARTTRRPRKAAATAARTPWGVAPYTRRSADSTWGCARAGTAAASRAATQSHAIQPAFRMPMATPSRSRWWTDTRCSFRFPALLLDRALIH